MVIVEESTKTGLQVAEEKKTEGNALFNKNSFIEAIDAYQVGLNHVSMETNSNIWSILHSNIALSYVKLGKYEEAVNHANDALKCPVNEKPLKHRSLAYEGLEKYTDALEDCKTILEKYPETKEKKAYEQKISSLTSLKGKQDEKLKEEMLGKLKDLGNMILRPFGLSTDSFQMTDDGHGGTSITMKQNGTEK